MDNLCKILEDINRYNGIIIAGEFAVTLCKFMKMLAQEIKKKGFIPITTELFKTANLSIYAVKAELTNILQFKTSHKIYLCNEENYYKKKFLLLLSEEFWAFIGLL